MEITVNRKISLEFLGEQYQEGFLTFKSIPLDELESWDAAVAKEEKKGGKGALEGMKNLLKERFVEGQFPNKDGALEPVTKDDLGKFDAGVFVHIVSVLQGGVYANPKGVNS